MAGRYRAWYEDRAMTGRTTPPAPTERESVRETAVSRHSGVALAVICCCQLMVVLDTTIVTVALPRIQSDLHLSATALSWVFNAYTLAFGGLLLLGGRAGDLLGQRRVLVAGALLFTVASAVGGSALTAAPLLLARAVQGIGAAVAAPTSLALIATTYREGPARGRALGVLSTLSAASMAIGLLLGGVLTSLSWRWVFWVNVPFGIAVVALAPFVLTESPRRRGRFDVTGALTSAAGAILLVYGFIEEASHGWGDPLTVGMLTAAVLLLAAFPLVERRARQPIMPLSLFADRDRAAAYAIRLLLTAAMSGMLFFLTLYVQDVRHFSPLWTGLAFLPTTLSLFLAGRWASRLISRVGPRPVLLAGGLITVAGMVWLTQVSAHTGYLAVVLGPVLLEGAGVGLLFVAVTVVGLSGVPAGDTGAASGVLSAMQQVGGSVGVAVLVTVYTAARHGAGMVAGIRGAFLAGTGFTIAVLLVALLVRRRSQVSGPSGGAGSRNWRRSSDR